MCRVNQEVCTDLLADKLKTMGLTIAVAEATCCGLIGHLLTNNPGSSRYFIGGLAPYANYGKVVTLGIPEALLRDSGSVSKETAMAMARKIRQLFNSDIGLAETGIAGPTGGTLGKPKGTFFIAISSKIGHEISRMHQITGDRNETREKAASLALTLLDEYLTIG